MNIEPKKNEIVHQDDVDFISDTKAALLNKSSSTARLILFSIGLLLLILIIWATFAEIDMATTATGKVIPSSKVKIVQSLDGGIIKKILVQEGDTVNVNQPVMIMDDTRYSSDYEQVFEKYVALQAIIARLKAQAYGEETIVFPQIVLSNSPDIAKSQEKLFIANKLSLQAELKNLQQSYDYAKQEVGILAPLVAKGIVPKIDYLRTEREMNDIQGKMLAASDDYHKSAGEELNQKEADLKSVTESLIALKDKMTHAIIKSPVKGIVKKLYYVTEGGVVNPGATVMDIVPVNDKLLIQVYVRPADIAFITVGQHVSIKVTAYDYSIYGDLDGKVQEIGADAIEDPNTQAGPNATKPPAYYLVNILADRNYIGTEKHKLPIIPGMTVSVNIITGKKTIMQYILKPLMKAKEEALKER